MASAIQVGQRAWLKLMHAEIAWTLHEAGIRCLILKGPSIAEWLYPDECSRDYADVDVLVDPALLEQSVTCLERRGYAKTHAGMRSGEPAAHSIDLSRNDPGLGLHGVDLHRFFPGLERNPQRTFEALWRRSITLTIAGLRCHTPSHADSALIIALHAAREPDSSKTGNDLIRCFGEMSQDELIHVRHIAHELHASSALKAGLSTQPSTRRFIDLLGLTDVLIPAHWQLQRSHATQTARRLNQLLDLPWRERPSYLLLWLFPSRRMMAFRNQEPAQVHGTALVRQYVLRLRDGMRELPSAVRAVHAARTSQTKEVDQRRVSRKDRGSH